MTWIDKEFVGFSIGNFEPIAYEDNEEVSSKQLSLNIGERIKVLKEHSSGWYYGFAKAYDGVERYGIFPCSVVAAVKSENQWSQSSEAKIEGKTMESSENTVPCVNALSRAKMLLRPTSFNSDLFPTLKEDSSLIENSDDSFLQNLLLHECSVILYRWRECMKDLLLQRNYDAFARIQTQAKMIIFSRKRINAGNLSKDEMSTLRKEVYHAIDKGNEILKLDVLVRNTGTGKVPEWTNTSVLDIYHQYKQRCENGAKKRPSKSGKSIKKNPISTVKKTYQWSESNTTTDPPFYHIWMDMKACVASICGPGESSYLYFYVYDALEDKFISEPYLVVLTSSGMPRDEDKIGKLRTLFIDYCRSDLRKSLYLVCRIYRSGQRLVDGRDGSSPNSGKTAGVMDKMVGGCLKYETNILASDSSFKRPFGVAVADLSPLDINGNENLELNMKIHFPSSEGNYSSLHSSIISGQSSWGHDSSNKNGELLCVSVRVFNGTLESITKSNSILSSSVVTPRFAKPDLQPFHDSSFGKMKEFTSMYLNLLYGEFNQGFKSGSKNIQVSVQVRHNKTGKFIRNVFVADGYRKEDRYHSTIFYHTNTPKWDEPLKITMDASLIPEVHLFFTFRHCSTSADSSKSKIFAFAFLPIYSAQDMVSLCDSQLSLCLYRYDENMNDPNVYIQHEWPPIIANGMSLLETPDQSKFRFYDSAVSSGTSSPSINNGSRFSLYQTTEVGQDDTLAETPAKIINFSFVTGSREEVSDRLRTEIFRNTIAKSSFSKDHMVVRFQMCSNEIPKNSNLSNLLNWNTKKTTMRLTNIINDFLQVPDTEIVLFFPQILNCIFELWKYSYRHAMNDATASFKTISRVNTSLSLMQRLAFKVFVHVIKVLTQSKYSAACLPILKRFLSEIEGGAVIAFFIVNSLINFTTNVDEESAQDLRNCIQNFEYIFKFITSSWDIYRANAVANDDLKNEEDCLKSGLSMIFTNLNAFVAKSDMQEFVTRTQLLIIQHFATVVNNLERFFEHKELANMSVAFCEAIPASKMNLLTQQLQLFYRLSQTSLFLYEVSRESIVKCICQKMKLYLSMYLQVVKNLKLEAGRDVYNPNDAVSVARKITNTRMQIQLNLTVSYSVDILSHIIAEYLAMMKSAGTSCPSVRHLSFVLPELVEYYVMMMQGDSNGEDAASDPSKGSLDVEELVSLIMTIFQILPHNYSLTLNVGQLRDDLFSEDGKDGIPVINYSGSFDTFFRDPREDEKIQFLSNLFYLIQQLDRNTHFSSTWIVIRKFLINISFKVMQQIYLYLMDEFIGGPEKFDINQDCSVMGSPRKSESELTRSRSFRRSIFHASSPLLISGQGVPIRNREVWIPYFLLVVEFLSLDLMHREDLDYEFRELFAQGSVILFEIWDVLSKLKLACYEELVEPILKLSILRQSKLSQTSFNIYFNMLKKEYEETGSLVALELNTASSLTNFFLDCNGTELYRELFISQMRYNLMQNPGEEGFSHVFEPFLDSMDTLMDCLLKLQSIPKESCFEDEMCLAKYDLVSYLETKPHLQELYFKYIFEISESNEKRELYVEAAYALHRLAKNLTWNYTKYVEAGHGDKLPRQTLFQRKEYLYNMIIDLFDRGKSWEEAIELCREMSNQYENVIFDYVKLSEVLERQSKFFRKMVSESRFYPEYFRVGYYGKGFPIFFRNRQFIYRGLPFEKLASFCERITGKHEDADLMKSNVQPGDDILESQGKYLQIVSVKPLLPEKNDHEDLDVNLNVSQHPTIPDSIRIHREQTNLNGFYFVRPYKKKSKEIEAINEFSNLWIEKTELSTIQSFPTALTICPVTSVEITHHDPICNAILTVKGKSQELLSLARKSMIPTANSSPFTMALNGAVDAAVQGGIKMYQDAFLGSAEVVSSKTKDLKKAIDEHLNVLRVCIEVHDKVVCNDLRPLHDKILLFFESNLKAQ